jgi:hypothetical protein
VFLVSNFSQSWKSSAHDLSFIHGGRHSHLHLSLSLTLLLPGQTASKLSIRWWPHGLCLNSWAALKGIQLLYTNTSSLTALHISLFITHTLVYITIVTHTNYLSHLFSLLTIHSWGMRSDHLSSRSSSYFFFFFQSHAHCHWPTHSLTHSLTLLHAFRARTPASLLYSTTHHIHLLLLLLLHLHTRVLTICNTSILILLHDTFLYILIPLHVTHNFDLHYKIDQWGSFVSFCHLYL